MTAHDRMPLENLLAQAGWAKALARQLVRDDGSADDLVQRTWVAALEHPPELPEGGAPATLRRWMAAVMRNFVRQDVRERDRRLERELRVARAETTTSSFDDGIEGQRKLLEILRSLPEPNRAALYARYFEGLMPREIARREGVPLKTVKSQLTRGLAVMRQRLDREHGGNREAWMAWIVPMAAKSATPTALIGALIVDSKLKLAGALLVAVAVLAVGARLLTQDSSLSEVASANAAAPSSVRESAEPSTEPADSKARVPASVAASAPSYHELHPVDQLETLDVVRGRVLDLDNRPVGGVRIVCEHGEPGTNRTLAEILPEDPRSDEGGYFELRPKRRDSSALVDDPRWVTVYKAYIGGKPSLDATIFVAPRIEFSGVVVDPAHHPVANAEIEMRLDASIKRNLERRLDSAYRENFAANCDDNGRFELKNAPACAAELVASAPGWSIGTIPAPALSTSGLEIVLGARDQRPAVVRGVVQDVAGKPIEGAHVGIGSLTMVTAADGRFTFDLDAEGYGFEFGVQKDGVWKSKFTRTHLRAVKFGLLPCEQALPPVDELRLDPQPREFTLVLDGAAMTIRGSVVDAEGNTIAGARVSLIDETPFGPIYDRVGESATAMEVSIEELLRGGQGFEIANSARDGTFVATGLTPRKYDLAALDKQTMRYGVLRAVDAGSRDVRIELRSNAALRHVAGRVVSNAGEGLAGISLNLFRQPENTVRVDFGRSLETDSTGHFDLGSVDIERLRIQVLGDEIFLIMGWEPPPDAHFDDLEIKVARRCPLKVELTPTAPAADAFSFVDAAGIATQNLRFEGPMLSLPERCTIADGVSEVVATEDTATTLLLYLKGKEVLRMPVHLEPGKLTIVRP